MAEKGRPTKYTEAIAEQICDDIAHSNKGLFWICKSKDEYPSAKVVYDWIERYEDFRNKYARARELQAEFLADEIIDIADDTSNDTLIHEKTGAEYANSEWINRSRLKVDARKWKASKLAPKKYGDKLEHTIDPEGVITEIIRTVISKKV